ncbi:MAG TPA: chemotaxis protein CheW [Stellaceae bacterium]|nr:chemotaxis protein CheW [Stellaceae bacterium]
MRSQQNQAGIQDNQKTGADEHAHQFMTFTLGAEEYGIDIMVVREIKGWTETTTIPNAPPHVRGVINLRGVVVPIFDLRARFGMGQTEPTKMHVVIIVSNDARTVGLLVDTVSDIISVNQDSIRPVPEMGLPTDDNFLDGLVTSGERMVTLVSLERLFASRSARLPTIDANPGAAPLESGGGALAQAS